MKKHGKLFFNLIATALLGAALTGPAAADPAYTVTFSQDNVYFQPASQCSYPAPQSGYYQTTNNSHYGLYQNGYPVHTHQLGNYYPTQGYQPVQGYQQPTYTVQQPAQAPVSQVTGNSFADHVLHLTNQERAKHGLAPLASHPALAAAALGHSQEMLNLGYLSHISPTPGRSSPEDRVRLAGANPGLVAENIFSASGYDVNDIAALAVENWLKSPGHRRNLLDPRATHIGIGFVEQNGEVAVTQVFGNRL